MITELLDIGREFEFVMTTMLGILVFGSFLLTVTTISNALRLRNVLLQWKEGALGGFPIFAGMFLFLSSLLLTVAISKGATDYYLITSGYLLISVNWLIASYLMSKKYITDHGIVKNINDPSQTISWTDIQDFLENENENGYTFVFMYSKNGVRRRITDYYRLELDVPRSKLYDFNKIMNHKLGRRFQQPEELSQFPGGFNIQKKQN